MQGNLLVKAVAGAVALDMKLKPFLDLFFDRCIESYLSEAANGPRGCFLVGTALTEALVREDVARPCAMRSARSMRCWRAASSVPRGKQANCPRARTPARWRSWCRQRCTNLPCTPAPA